MPRRASPSGFHVDYRSTLRVRANDPNGPNGSKVEWSGTFTPHGATDDDTAQLFRGIYEDGLAELAKRFAAV
nr:SRPBCC family protein [Burkholderia ambifaria]